MVIISFCTFAGNQTTGGAGGTGASEGQSNGGAIRLGTSGGPGGSAFVGQSTFTGNRATGGAGGAGADGGGGFGGAFQNNGPNWTIALSHNTFTGNRVTAGPAGRAATAALARAAAC